MEPICLVPICQARYYNGSNSQEIADWVGMEVVSVTEQQLGLRVASDEVLWLPTGYWLLAAGADPARVVDMMSDEMLRTRYAVHPGPVTEPVAAP
ncbi:hypothetical protein [Micromonospora haikouensis]|uniref:hypothetical protein n=1 Tax=Micromonospora haikouensis TaxID=686309 RepID=UPI003D75354C